MPGRQLQYDLHKNHKTHPIDPPFFFNGRGCEYHPFFSMAEGVIGTSFHVTKRL